MIENIFGNCWNSSEKGERTDVLLFQFQKLEAIKRKDRFILYLYLLIISLK